MKYRFSSMVVSEHRYSLLIGLSHFVNSYTTLKSSQRKKNIKMSSPNLTKKCLKDQPCFANSSNNDPEISISTIRIGTSLESIFILKKSQYVNKCSFCDYYLILKFLLTQKNLLEDLEISLNFLVLLNQHV